MLSEVSSCKFGNTLWVSFAMKGENTFHLEVRTGNIPKVSSERCLKFIYTAPFKRTNNT